MAAAPDLETLLNYAGNHRAAAKAIMLARLATKPAFRLAKVVADTDIANKSSPCLEVHYIHGAPITHRRTCAPGHADDTRYAYPDIFTGQLIFEVWTNRNVPANAALHEPFCAMVRATMLRFGDYFTVDRLPYYNLTNAAPQAEGVMTDAETKTLDITRIPYDVRFEIYGDAWPEGT